jgi:hypothetical protein
LDVIRSPRLRRSVTVIPRWLLRREYLLFVRDVRRPLPDLPVTSSLRWELAAERTLPHLRTVDPPLPEGEIRRRWNKGQQCLLYWLEDTPVYLFSEATQPVFSPYLGRTFQPVPGDYLVFDLFLRPAFWGHAIGTVSTIVGLHRAAQAGRDAAVAHGVLARVGVLAGWRDGDWPACSVRGLFHVPERFPDQLTLCSAAGCVFTFSGRKPKPLSWQGSVPVASPAWETSGDAAPHLD